MPLFARQARTFRQKARLAITLSWVAGYVNVSIVAVCGVTVSHVTGNVTTFGLHLAKSIGGHEQLLTVLFLLHLPLGFLLGAMSAQLMLRIAERHHAMRPAAGPVAAEAILLAALSAALGRFTASGNSATWLWIVTSLGTVAMGLQNATITRISGSVVRTTHLTGVTTDLGTELVDLLLWLGKRLRSGAAGRWRRVCRALPRRPAAARVFILSAIFLSFLAGATGGSWVVMQYPFVSLWPPTAFLAVLLMADVVRMLRTRRRILMTRPTVSP